MVPHLWLQLNLRDSWKHTSKLLLLLLLLLLLKSAGASVSVPAIGGLPAIIHRREGLRR